MHTTGVFIARGKEDTLATHNLVSGDAVYGEKRIIVDIKYILLCMFLLFFFNLF